MLSVPSGLIIFFLQRRKLRHKAVKPSHTVPWFGGHGVRGHPSPCLTLLRVFIRRPCASWLCLRSLLSRAFLFPVDGLRWKVQWNDSPLGTSDSCLSRALGGVSCPLSQCTRHSLSLLYSTCVHGGSLYVCFYPICISCRYEKGNCFFPLLVIFNTCAV